MYALILAGGKGERLKPLTETLPKPMVPLCGKPILWHQIAWLKQAGVTDVVFLVGYHWQTVKEYFGDGSRFNIHAHYAVEEKPLGRGGAIRNGLSLVPESTDSVLVINGDIISAENLSDVLACHEQRKAINTGHLATIMLTPLVSPYGVVDTNAKGEVVAFREKINLPYWINAGVYVFDRSIYQELPDVGDHETDTFPRIAGIGKMVAHKSLAFWRSVDTFKDLSEAENYLRLAS
jgi:NDP-sugar pyrophosphorylase family protein